MHVLCMGCMAEKGDRQRCPNCGWEEGCAPDSPLHLSPRTLLHDKYLIGRVLGQGGFGITYLAWDINLNLKLAIKEYLPQDLASRAVGVSQVVAYTGSLSGEFEYGLEKFLQEARTLAQFEGHPNIVSVRDFFRANGTTYIVMSYVEGVTLKDHLAHSGNRLPFDKASAIIMPVLDALMEVHAVNILHRDISPDNIFINRKGQVILIDFGAARHAIGEKGRSLSIILKPGYTPEEQYRSKGIQGPWTDLYAVAATLYRMVTGQMPQESLERLVEDTLIPPSRLGVALSDYQEQALLKSMAVRAADRFQTVKEFQEALLAYPIAAPLVEAGGPPTAPREILAGPAPYSLRPVESLPGPLSLNEKPAASPRQRKSPVLLAFIPGVLFVLGLAALLFSGTITVPGFNLAWPGGEEQDSNKGVITDSTGNTEETPNDHTQEGGTVDLPDEPLPEKPKPDEPFSDPPAAESGFWSLSPQLDEFTIHTNGGFKLVITYTAPAENVSLHLRTAYYRVDDKTLAYSLEDSGQVAPDSSRLILDSDWSGYDLYQLGFRPGVHLVKAYIDQVEIASAAFTVTE